MHAPFLAFKTFSLSLSLSLSIYLSISLSLSLSFSLSLSLPPSLSLVLPLSLPPSFSLSLPLSLSLASVAELSRRGYPEPFTVELTRTGIKSSSSQGGYLRQSVCSITENKRIRLDTSSIYMYRNDVGSMYSHSNLFFVFCFIRFMSIYSLLYGHRFNIKNPTILQPMVKSI
jgi:hypothetical protein